MDSHVTHKRCFNPRPQRHAPFHFLRAVQNAANSFWPLMIHALMAFDFSACAVNGVKGILPQRALVPRQQAIKHAESKQCFQKM